jgi:hypothetical protein
MNWNVPLGNRLSRRWKTLKRRITEENLQTHTQSTNNQAKIYHSQTKINERERDRESLDRGFHLKIEAVAERVRDRDRVLNFCFGVRT